MIITSRQKGIKPTLKANLMHNVIICKEICGDKYRDLKSVFNIIWISSFFFPSEAVEFEVNELFTDYCLQELRKYLLYFKTRLMLDIYKMNFYLKK